MIFKEMSEEKNYSAENTKQHCIACGYHLTYPIYSPGNHPLSVLHLPKSEQEAINITKYPMNFRRCASCGHIYNVDFDYSLIPYEENSNLMFNKGSSWKVFMDEMVSNLNSVHGLKNKIIVEIGCGDGHFLERIKQVEPTAKCIGFEPGIEHKTVSSKGIEVYNDYFKPERDMAKLRPDILICRHVIEHLENPKYFVSEISYWSNQSQVFPIFLAEVPLINKAIKHSRINDYLFEHVSNFTDFSFSNMFRISGYKVLEKHIGYGGEVIVTISQPLNNKKFASIRKSSEKYYSGVAEQREKIKQELLKIRKNNTIAFWGGTGKGASLLNGFELSVNEFSVVVDSDPMKIGFHVPGTGQKIISPEDLKQNPCDIIFICTQWRAKDIYSEICKRQIPHKKVLVLINKKIKEYKGEDI